MSDIYKTIKELKSKGYPKNVLYKYDFLEFVNPNLTADEMTCFLDQVANLTEKDKEIFFLRYKGCMTCVEIGAVVGLTAAQVTSRLDSMLLRLIRLLKQQNVVIEKQKPQKDKVWRH